MAELATLAVDDTFATLSVIIGTLIVGAVVAGRFIRKWHSIPPFPSASEAPTATATHGREPISMKRGRDAIQDRLEFVETRQAVGRWTRSLSRRASRLSEIEPISRLKRGRDAIQDRLEFVETRQAVGRWTRSLSHRASRLSEITSRLSESKRRRVASPMALVSRIHQWRRRAAVNRPGLTLLARASRYAPSYRVKRRFTIGLTSRLDGMGDATAQILFQLDRAKNPDPHRRTPALDGRKRRSLYSPEVGSAVDAIMLTADGAPCNRLHVWLVDGEGHRP